MLWLRLLFWPILLAPAVWWAWTALHSPPPAQTLQNGAELTWGDCWFDSPWWRPLHCGRLKTAAEPGQEPFSLPVVYVPQWFWRRHTGPVQYIAGGPGGSAWLDDEGVAFWLDWMEQVRLPGDLVLYDQRGVGESEPAYACPELMQTRRDILPLPLPTEDAYRRVRDATMACHQRLRAEGVDLGRFTTAHNARDAVDLMRAMGLSSWDLYAVSYGTRIALEVMRREPQALRSAVLDSVYPPQVNAELSEPWLLQRALGLVTRICQLADDCETSAADLGVLLDKAFDRVARERLRLSVRDPDDGSDLAVVYDRDDLAWLLFEALYQWDAIPDLPDSLRALADGRLDADMRVLIQESVDAMLDDSISDPIASSVDCHDAGPVDGGAMQRELEHFPDVAEIKRLDWQYHACRFWESGRADLAFRTPVVSDVPTLLLAGEFDPVTPPQWAEMAQRHLAKSFLFVFPAIGHGVLDSHACAVDVVNAFLVDPDGPPAAPCLSGL